MSGYPMRIEAFVGWLGYGERGLSSEYIVERLTGIPLRGGLWQAEVSEPRDPADFRRCEVLLRVVPEARTHLAQVASASSTWARLVAEWDELVSLAEAEAPTIFGLHPAPGSTCPQLFARMQELRKEVEVPA